LSEEKVFSVRYWGTRGSIPTPGGTTVRYGGNTSCVEIRADNVRIVLDAGTGIRPLGEWLRGSADPKRASIFLTHFHWDHVQGFPFFTPAYDPEFKLRIFGPTQDGLDLETLIRKQMGPISFPIPFESLTADLAFHPMNGGSWAGGEVQVHALRVRHTCFTVGYRVEAFGRSVVFVPDNELKGGNYPVGTGWEEAFLAFVSGADLLIHDSTYTDQEYSAKEGWGHSTFRQSMDLAERAGVSTLHFFHHSPHRSDDELDVIVKEMKDEVAASGLGLEVEAAAENRDFHLGKEASSWHQTTPD
jgi:phosphoribosyl 1,2-cyclic phosphodiesterase